MAASVFYDTHTTPHTDHVRKMRAVTTSAVAVAVAQFQYRREGKLRFVKELKQG